MQTGVSEEDLPSLTAQLQRFSDGDSAVAESVLREVFPELHRVAMRALAREQQAPFSATELIHEIWLRKLRQGGWKIESRQHFYAIAALAMRQVLIDFARLRNAQRREGAMLALSLDETVHGVRDGGSGLDALLQVGILMDKLEQRNPKAARIVDLHYFAGFTLKEIAGITGLSARQVRHRWESGRNWIKDGLSS